VVPWYYLASGKRVFFRGNETWIILVQEIFFQGNQSQDEKDENAKIDTRVVKLIALNRFSSGHDLGCH